MIFLTICLKVALFVAINHSETKMTNPITTLFNILVYETSQYLMYVIS